MMRHLCYLLLVTLPWPVSANEWRIEAWQQQQLMLSRSPPELVDEREWLVVIDSPAPPQAMLNLILDYQAVSRWMQFSEQASLLAQPAPNQHQMHIRFDVPWPLLGRDVTSDSHYWRDEFGWWLEIRAEPELLPPVSGHLRVQQMQTCWSASATASGSRVLYLGYLVDPGAVPGFMIHELRKSALFDSLQAFSKRSRLPEYQLPPPYLASSQLRGWGYCQRLQAAMNSTRLQRLLAQ